MITKTQKTNNLTIVRNVAYSQIKKMKKKITLNCHCGEVQLDLYLPNGFEKIRRCNCSICSRKGAVVSSVLKKNLTVVKGQKLLSKYQFNTKTAKHYFCSQCGIYTHHQRRSDPKEFGINMGCIDGFDLSSY